ncbi:DUF3558 domain-containing protein [Amycolatopsis bartoniae]|nr:DUF3558 domain-containing protein [Amycolatopsis bartoniae]
MFPLSPGDSTQDGRFRVRKRTAALVTVPLISLALTSACTSTIGGTAQPDPARVTVTPQASTDPCSLLTSDEAEELGLQVPGVPREAEPASRIPPSCNWSSTNPDSELDGSLQVFLSTDLNVREYYSSAPDGQEEFGGVTWDHYPSVIGDSMCDYAVTLAQLSFVTVSSQNFGDTTKACDTARAAAPLVAKHLPR